MCEREARTGCARGRCVWRGRSRRIGIATGSPESRLMKELIFRFLTGGVMVSAFAFLGDIFRPKSFAGLFGAAPSIALATLALTILTDGKEYAAVEARSMVGGAI